MARTRQPQSNLRVAPWVRCAFNSAIGEESLGSGVALVNGPTKTVNPEVAYGLDGSKLIRIARNRGPYLLNSFILLFRFRQVSAPGQGGTYLDVFNGGNSTNRFIIYSLNSGLIRADNYNSGGTPYTSDSASGLLSDGNDYTLAVEYDGAGQQWYSNGSATGSRNANVIARDNEHTSFDIGGAAAGAASGIDLSLFAIVDYAPGRAQQLTLNPWQLFAPERRLWIQLGAAAGGGATTETTLTTTVSAVSTIASLKMRLIELLATVAAAFTGSRFVSATRSAASTTGAVATRAIVAVKSATTTASSVLARAVSKIVSATASTVATIANQVTSGAQTFYRELTAAATAGALAVRQSNLTQSAMATASAAYLRAVGAVRTATATATATQTSIKVKLQQLITTPLNTVATATRAIAATRLASAAVSAAATLRVGVYLSAAANAVATRLAAVAHKFSVATATATATVTTLKVKLKELVTGAVSTAATLTRQTLAERVATLTATATAQRAISSTLVATQPVTAVAVKAISKTLAAAASVLSDLVRQLLSGSFWSADRTYTIAAAPRTYTIAAAPRTFTV